MNLNPVKLIKKSILAKITVILLAFLLLLFTVFAWTYVSTSKQKADGLIINVAGAQRMLSQKITKEVMLFLSDPNGWHGALGASMSAFEKRLLVLKGGGDIDFGGTKVNMPAPPEHIKVSLNKVFNLWQEFKSKIEVVIAERLKDSAAYGALDFIVNNNIDLRDKMNEVVNMLQENKASAKIVNVAGAQRMLSQKIAKEAIQYIQSSTEDVGNMLKADRDKFELSLITLRDGGELEVGGSVVTIPKPSAKLKTAMNDMFTLWGEFKLNINTILSVREKHAVGEEALEFVNKNSIPLKNLMHASVGLMQAESEKKVTALISAQVIILLVGIGIVLFAYSYLRKNIVVPVKRAAEFAALISSGDLTGQLKVNSQDEIGILANSMSTMSADLSTLVKQIKDSTVQLAGASDEISSASQQVADGAQQQAASFENVARAVQVIADNAKETYSGTTEMAQKASKIEEAMSHTNATMQDIEKSSHLMNAAVEIITDIAGQTNLLALNAAIEAARAGELGKGFAVVADEVRKLAERSGQAANEIGDTIKTNVAHAEEGARLVVQAETLVNEIIEVVNKNVEMVKAITNATNEQSATMSDNAAITESNAAASEELASASEELSGQAESLKQNISYLKV